MWEQKDKQFFRQGDAVCLGSVIVVGGKRVRGGEKCRDRDPRKDVHREPEKGRVRDPVSVRVRIRTMAVSVLVICARVWGPRDGKLPCSRSWWHLHVLIILKTSK